jgi:hypothetical protein
MRCLPLACLGALLLAIPAGAQEKLDLVEEVPWKPFRRHCLQLLDGLKALKAPLPEATARKVRKLLDAPADRDAAVKVQKLLDPHCLVGVSINPESRVKAHRGGRAAELTLGRPTWVLVKIDNDAGVTAALNVAGPQVIRKGKRTKNRWLEAAVETAKPFNPKLTGQRVEYRVIRLVPREAGKREATLQFDVGQGTQDLGFRAEVPILFTITKD